MPFFKVTFIFECRNKGWSESYYRENGSSDPFLLRTVSDDLLKKRIAVAGKEVTCTYMRIANIETKRRVRLFFLGDTRKGVVGKPADNPESALILKMQDTTGGRAKTTFLRGYWDAVVDDGGNYVPTIAFENELDDFIQKLKVDSWAWLGVNVQTDFALATLVQDAGGTVSGTLTGNLFTLPQVGKVFAVRFRRITQPGNLNGQNPVLVTAQNAFKTVKRIAILPWSGDGNIQISTKSLVLIDTASVTGVSERKTGRVFGSPRGRLPARRRA